MKDIYSFRPVNKTAAIVTNQSGCTDSFLVDDKETLKILGKRKAHFANLCRELKKEIGIDGREGSGAKTKYPKRILLHPKFKLFLGVKEALYEIDKEISDVKKRIPPKTGCNFSERFIHVIKEMYPDIYKEIKQIVKKDNQCQPIKK